MQKRGNTEKRIFAVLAALVLTGCPFAAQAVDVTGNDSEGVVVIESGDVTTGSPSGIVLSIDNVYGWDNYGTDASGGSVTITDSTVGNVYGGHMETGNVDGNAVTINSGTFSRSGSGDISIYGGYTDSGSADDNVVTINNGEFTHSGSGYVYIHGGTSNSNAATGNSLTISGGTFTSNSATYSNNVYFRIFGGSANTSGDAIGNSTTISGGTFENIGNGNAYFNIYGGSANVTGDAINNTLTISGGTFTNNNVGSFYTYGGNVNNTGNATDNNVTISGDSEFSTTYGSVVIRGGFVGGTGDATDNNVTIGGSTTFSAVSGSVNVSGGQTNSGSATGNEVNIDGGAFTSNSDGINIYGGYGTDTTSENEVNISDGYFSAGGNIQVLGGYSRSTGSATGNTVNLSGGEFSASGSSSYVAISGGVSLYGGSTDNTVNVDGGGFTGTYLGIAGGYVYGSSDGSISGNEVNIYSGDFAGNSYLGIGGGVAFSASGDNSSLSDNTVNIYGGNFTGTSLGIAGGYVLTASGDNSSLSDNTVNIYGGTFESSGNIYIYGGYTPSGDVTGNTVNLSGGTFESSTDIYAGYATSGTVTDNLITISGLASLENANLYGRNDEAAGSGNTLAIDGWSGTINSIANFDAITFANADFTDTDTAAITLTETADLTNTSSIEVTSISGVQNLQQGDVYTLIDNAVGYEGTESVSGLVGVAMDYTATIAQDATENAVVMTIDDTSLNSQTGIITEAGAAGAAFLNSGADLISDGLDILGRDEQFGTKVFAAVQGVRSKYDMASRVKINGWNVIAGIGSESAHGEDKLSWAAFYEGGTGRFRTWNKLENEFFHTNGSLSYNGGGIAARYEAANGLYTEASVRAGHLDTSMNNALMDASGSTYGYDTESSYWGAHIGIGKRYHLSENRDLDIYGKYFHTDVDGDSFTVAGDTFDLSSITSDRLRIGARIHSNKQSDIQGYYGLAWEYEFDGDAEMSAYGLSSKESFGGTSGMAEAGFTWRPHYTSPWLFDMNLRGYVGEREGGSLTVQASYSF